MYANFVRFSYWKLFIGFLICKSHVETRVRCRLRNRSLESIWSQENKIFSERILYKNQVESFQTSNQLQLAFFFKFLVFFQGWTPVYEECFVPIWGVFKLNLPTYFNKTILNGRWKRQNFGWKFSKIEETQELQETYGQSEDKYFILLKGNEENGDYCNKVLT